MLPNEQIDRIENLRSEAKRIELGVSILLMLGEQLNESVNISPMYFFEVHVYTREDLSLLMTLAPTWNKSYDKRCISYTAHVGGIPVTLRAYQAALPPTCVEEEVEIVVDAQPAKEAYTYTEKRIKCDLPA